MKKPMFLYVLMLTALIFGSKAYSFFSYSSYAEDQKFWKEAEERKRQEGRIRNNGDNFSRIFLRIKENNIEKIKRFIKKYGDDYSMINIISDPGYYWNRSQMTPLSLVLDPKYKNEEVALLLLSAKEIEVNVKDSNGQRPLHLACANGMPNIVKELLKKGARKNVKDKDGNTPIDKAIKCGNLGTVKLLLKYGAKVDDGSIRLAQNRLEQNNRAVRIEPEILRYLNLARECDIAPDWMAVISGHEQEGDVYNLLVRRSFAQKRKSTTGVQDFVNLIKNCRELHDCVVRTVQ